MGTNERAPLPVVRGGCHHVQNGRVFCVAAAAAAARLRAEHVAAQLVAVHLGAAASAGGMRAGNERESRCARACCSSEVVGAGGSACGARNCRGRAP